jgi:AraC family transcriptional regulator, regulatory protein of adaptative response / DNA-3-methyladenine glycosylase II
VSETRQIGRVQRGMLAAMRTDPTARGQTPPLTAPAVDAPTSDGSVAAALWALDDDHRYLAVCSRDQRFDGRFFTAVVTTGIYCRPSCPATTPKRVNMRFYPSAAAAQQAGFRACKRCRPDATPGSPEWDTRADVVGRAVRLIADGLVDREGVGGLARRLGYGERHVHRLLTSELGAGPLALARAQRARAARTLLETTDLRVADIAFAAGFASVRQCNDTVREVFAVTPTALRTAARSRRGVAPPGWIVLRLPFRPPCDVAATLGFLAMRAVPGIEEGDGERYARTLALPHGTGVVEVRTPGPGDAWVPCALRLDDLRDLTAAVQRTRQLLDLDADPHAIAAVLGVDPVLGPLVAAAPGLRVPGHVDGRELAVRAVLGQQVSVAGARTLAGRLVAAHGRPLAEPVGTLTHLFPEPAALAAVDVADLAMPRARGRALVALTAALADGSVVLDPGVDRDAAAAALHRLPGIGPWTVDYIRVRALRDPDVFLPTDLGVHHALAARGADPSPRAATARAAAWRPWRSYALLHLWHGLSAAPLATVEEVPA